MQPRQRGPVTDHVEGLVGSVVRANEQIGTPPGHAAPNAHGERPASGPVRSTMLFGAQSAGRRISILRRSAAKTPASGDTAGQAPKVKRVPAYDMTNRSGRSRCMMRMKLAPLQCMGMT